MTSNLSKEQAKERKNEILRTFTRMVDYAKKNNVKVILIAGDLLPTESNMKLFEEGKSREIFGEELISLFQNCDYRIVNIEGSFTDSKDRIDKSGPCLKASVKSFHHLILHESD